MRATIARMRAENGGIALVEFAFVLPVLLVLYLAGYQVSDIIACNRKVTVATRAVGDLVTQYAMVTPAQLDQILAATTQVMSPYPNRNALIRVSQITTDDAGNGTVSWSRAINGAQRKEGAAFTMPSVLKPTYSTTYIYAETNYSYVPVVDFGFISSKSLTESIYMVPRVSSVIDCDKCT